MDTDGQRMTMNIVRVTPPPMARCFAWRNAKLTSSKLGRLSRCISPIKFSSLKKRENHLLAFAIKKWNGHYSLWKQFRPGAQGIVDVSCVLPDTFCAVRVKMAVSYTACDYRDQQADRNGHAVSNEHWLCVSSIFWGTSRSQDLLVIERISNPAGHSADGSRHRTCYHSDSSQTWPPYHEADWCNGRPTNQPIGRANSGPAAWNNNKKLLENIMTGVEQPNILALSIFLLYQHPLL